MGTWSARRLALALLLAAPLAGCGADDAAPSVSSDDLTEFSCTASHVEAGRPLAYFGPFDPVDKEALCVLDLAQKEVVVAHYNIRMQPFLDKLVELAARGVVVKVAVDEANSKQTWNTGDDFLEAHGIQVVRTKPVGQTAIMHLKVTVIDGKIAMAGSFNWNATAALANDENMIVVRDQAVVQKYRDEVLEVLGEKKHSVDGGQATEAIALHFSPEEKLDAVISERIAAASESVDVAMFTLTSGPVADALIAAQKRGVRVRVVTERKQAESTPIDEKIAASGALVIQAANHVGEFSAMHHKYAVIDGHLVITGATNWTYSGTRQNEEDLLVADIPELAAQYRKSFADLLHVYTGVDQADPPAKQGGLLFHAIQPGTQYGDRVVAVGDDPALGSWDPSAGIEMHTSDDLFPSWTGRLSLPAGRRIEFKFVTVRAGGEIAWEPGANRVATVPASGRSSVLTGNYGDTSRTWTPADEQ